MYIINKSIKLYKHDLFGSYISLLPLTPLVKRVTLKGFKYPLNEHDIEIGYSIGVSNEIIDDCAEIIFESGILVVVESRD